MKRVGVLIAFVLAGLAASASAFAETIVQKVPPCPPVYGTWRTTHVVDHHFRTQPISEIADTSTLIREVRIRKGGIEAAWFGGKNKSMSSQWSEYANDDVELCTSKARWHLHVYDSDSMLEVLYFPYDGYLDIFFHDEVDGGYYERQHVRMRRLK